MVNFRIRMKQWEGKEPMWITFTVGINWSRRLKVELWHFFIFAKQMKSSSGCPFAKVSKKLNDMHACIQIGLYLNLQLLYPRKLEGECRLRWEDVSGKPLLWTFFSCHVKYMSYSYVPYSCGKNTWKPAW